MNAAPDIKDVELDQLIACHECDLLMLKPHVGHGQKASCPRCGFSLIVHRAAMERRSLALVLTALLLFIPANFLPIMHLALLGQTTQDTVWSGVQALYETGMWHVALVVLLSSLVIPLCKLLCQLFVLVSIRTRRGLPQARALYRTYQHLREWGMLEVYLMGILVSIVKLVSLAELQVSIGLACFVGLLLAQVWLEATMSPHQVWDALDGDADARD